MDRRELFKAIAGVAAGAGVVGTVKVAEASERSVPALAVLECAGHISQETATRLRECFEHGMNDTPFKGIKVVVLGDGLRLTLLDANGHVLNRDIGEV